MAQLPVLGSRGMAGAYNDSRSVCVGCKRPPGLQQGHNACLGALGRLHLISGFHRTEVKILVGTFMALISQAYEQNNEGE